MGLRCASLVGSLSVAIRFRLSLPCSHPIFGFRYLRLDQGNMKFARKHLGNFLLCKPSSHKVYKLLVPMVRVLSAFSAASQVGRRFVERRGLVRAGGGLELGCGLWSRVRSSRRRAGWVLRPVDQPERRLSRLSRTGTPRSDRPGGAIPTSVHQHSDGARRSSPRKVPATRPGCGVRGTSIRLDRETVRAGTRCHTKDRASSCRQPSRPGIAARAGASPGPGRIGARRKQQASSDTAILSA